MMDIKEGRHLVVAVDDCEVGASSCFYLRPRAAYQVVSLGTSIACPSCICLERDAMTLCLFVLCDSRSATLYFQRRSG